MDGSVSTDDEGDHFMGWMNEWKVSDEVRHVVSRQGHLGLVVLFAKECDMLCDALNGAYPEFKDTLALVNQRLPTGKKKTGRMGTYCALSYLMATLEDSLLRHLEEFLMSKNFQIDSLEFDALKLRRPDGDDGPFPEAILREAEEYLATQQLCGGVAIPMELSEKKLDTPFGAVLNDRDNA